MIHVPRRFTVRVLRRPSSRLFPAKLHESKSLEVPWQFLEKCWAVFEILGLLGEGEHAKVYRAYDPILERDIALKVPRHGMVKSVKVVDRFLGEAKALARLRHPRIVPVYEAGCAADRYYIAMALIEGRSLAERLTESPLTVQHAVEITADLADALAYAHTQGVIHRDVKPANVRLDEQGAVYLMDFSIAYRPESGELPLPPGMILGTPAYLAPEQRKEGNLLFCPLAISTVWVRCSTSYCVDNLRFVGLLPS